MATFVYEARDASGQRVSGTLTADNSQAALRDLDRRQLMPLDLREMDEAAALGAKGLRIGKRLVSTRRLSMLYAQLADLLNAGVPLLRALEVLVRQNQRRVGLARVLDDVRSQVAGGTTFADSLGRFPSVFPDLHTAMVRAGEEGGFIEDVLTRLANFTERQDELRSKVLGSLAYPCFLLFMGTAIVILLMVFFVPKFAGFLDPTRMDLPMSTKILLKVSTFMEANWMFGLIGMVAVVGGLYGVLSSEAGRAWWDRTRLRLPMIGQVIALMAVARFCRVLGTLIKNGVGILSALRISRDSIGNRTLAAVVDESIEAVRRGEPLAVPLSKGGYFPADILDMIDVAEQSNTLDTVLVNVAESTERRLARSIDTLVRLIEPMLLLVMALVVFAIAFSLLLPIFSMSTSGV
ncbi:MAG: Type II secretion system protein F [Phycisphaerae bacterium]|nr:Type II secretion system protein F [Phycisphaerae bacterium]